MANLSFVPTYVVTQTYTTNTTTVGANTNVDPSTLIPTPAVATSGTGTTGIVAGFITDSENNTWATITGPVIVQEDITDTAVASDETSVIAPNWTLENVTDTATTSDEISIVAPNWTFENVTDTAVLTATAFTQAETITDMATATSSIVAGVGAATFLDTATIVAINGVSTGFSTLDSLSTTSSIHAKLLNDSVSYATSSDTVPATVVQDNNETLVATPHAIAGLLQPVASSAAVSTTMLYTAVAVQDARSTTTAKASQHIALQVPALLSTAYATSYATGVQVVYIQLLDTIAATAYAVTNLLGNVVDLRDTLRVVGAFATYGSVVTDADSAVQATASIHTDRITCVLHDYVTAVAHSSMRYELDVVEVPTLLETWSGHINVLLEDRYDIPLSSAVSVSVSVPVSVSSTASVSAGVVSYGVAV